MPELAASDRVPVGSVNAPVPRHDARAPAAVLLGLAGVAALALLARRRRSSAQRSGAGGSVAAVPDTPAGAGPSVPALLVGGAVIGGGALAVWRVGAKRVLRHAPLIRAAFAWAAHPRPLLPLGRGVVRKRDLARLALAMAEIVAGGNRREQARIVAGALLGSMVAVLLARRGAASRSSRPRTGPDGAASVVDDARKQLHLAAALLGLSVLLDSGVEHYRACFANPAMYTPLIVSSLTILVNAHALAAGGGLAGVRNAVHLTTGLVGVIGLGFHFYNIGKRPGGYSWLNFFYGAPFGAPAALTLAALIGFAAEQLDAGKGPGEQRVAGLPFAPIMAGLVSVGLAGTVVEVTLLHFRGAFHNPFMWLPVSLPPVAAALMAKQALAPADGDAWITRGWLWATVVLGIGGVGFHAYGVSRNMGGWYNWSQNILAGPPLPAPPSFSALALAGLGVLDLIEAGR